MHHLFNDEPAGARLVQLFRALIAPALGMEAPDPGEERDIVRLIYAEWARLMIVDAPVRDDPAVLSYAGLHAADVLAIGRGDEVIEDLLCSVRLARRPEQPLEDLSFWSSPSGDLWLVSDDSAPAPITIAVTEAGLVERPLPPFVDADDRVDGLSRAASRVRRALREFA